MDNYGINVNRFMFEWLNYMKIKFNQDNTVNLEWDNTDFKTMFEVYVEMKQLEKTPKGEALWLKMIRPETNYNPQGVYEGNLVLKGKEAEEFKSIEVGSPFSKLLPLICICNDSLGDSVTSAIVFLTASAIFSPFY